VLHYFVKTTPQFFCGRMEDPEALGEAADGYAEVMNGVGIVGLFRGVAEVSFEAVEANARFVPRVLRDG